MEIDGVYYVAQVKEKEEARKQYKEAVEKGSTAGDENTKISAIVRL